MTTIIDYGVGNLNSIKNMLWKIGVAANISQRSDDILVADKLILPGVGHFDHCMKELRKLDTFDIIEKRVLEDKIDVLGVCAGCQMLMEESEEGKEKGLGWIKGKVIKFDSVKMPSGYKIPHMAWSDVTVKNNCSLYVGIEEPRFYFVHSYHIVCDNINEVTGTAEYGYSFTASIQKKNIRGVQFHPEKSHRFGMRLLKNFAKQY